MVQPKVPFRKYPTYLDSGVNDQFVMPVCRKVYIKNIFEPVIHSVQLCKIKNSSGTELLRMSFTGMHLYEIVLEKCQFYFSFPFARDAEKTTVKKVSMGESIQRLVIEEPLKEQFVMPDHGTNLLLVTQFGMCEKIIHRADLRDISIQNTTQIARYDSVSLVIRRAIQRGMGLAKIKREMGSGSFNKIIQEIKDLGEAALGHQAMAEMEKMFDDYQKDFHFIMSNEEAFEKVKGFCQQIEDYLRSPMEIQAEWNVVQKIGFGLAVTLGSVAAAYIAGPGLVVVGITQGGAGAMGLGGVFGGVAAGAAANILMKEKLTDSVYENTLKWINHQLLEARQKTLDERIQLQIVDLQDDGGVYNNEKILMLLTDHDEKLLSVFDNCALGQCTEKSRETVRKRIKSIKMIHRIRDIFSQQCFIGLVGLQDAGKTTLLKKMWGVGGKTGFFTHTDVPLMYELNQKVLIVDFPGSNSLDYHSKTFSICGAMNNMVIVLIPFSGDVSRKVISDEIQTVFGVMRGSESTKVLLCVNKWGMYLERLKEELKGEEKPVEFMKKRFVEKMNEHFEMSGTEIVIKTSDVLFTDWELGENEEASRFGIEGVDAVRERIMEYLVSYGIYKAEEREELMKCVSEL